MKTSNLHTRFLPISLLMWLLCVPLTSLAETYSYDDSGRLTSVTYHDDSLLTYSYDANGNIISRTTGNLTDICDVHNTNEIIITNVIYTSINKVVCSDSRIVAGPSVTVDSNSDISYKAPQIILLPGFSVETGGKFDAGTL